MSESEYCNIYQPVKICTCPQNTHTFPKRLKNCLFSYF